jgi:hypothetical protein
LTLISHVTDGSTNVTFRLHKGFVAPLSLVFTYFCQAASYQKFYNFLLRKILDISMLNKIVGTVIVNVGAAGVIASFVWGLMDYSALIQANQKLQSMQSSGSDRQIQLLMHRENNHHINVGFEGVWLGLSAILVALGYIAAKK